MKTINKTALASSLLMISGIVAAAEPFSFGGNVTLTSDYVFRGFTQTMEDPAIQGGFDINHESGVYAGVWASNVKFGVGDPAHLELDYSLGYSSELGNGVNYDLAYYYYTYPGVEDNLNYDFSELKLGLGYQMFNAEYYYSNDFFGGVGKAHYFSLGGDFELGQGFTAGWHVGRQNFSDLTDSNYTDWNVSVGRTLAGVDFSLAYSDTNVDNAAGVADGRVYFSASKSF